MPRNRVQHQKGLSDDAFERLYPDEEACRKAWFAWRWPEGFECPRCAATEYRQISDRQLIRQAALVEIPGRRPSSMLDSPFLPWASR
jgi:Transposase zinc-ribbon domain